MKSYYFNGQWSLYRFSELGEENFNRLSLRLLRVEISSKVQPANKKGKDNKCDALLRPCENNYGLDGTWWFQYKFRDVTRNDNRTLKRKFKRELVDELEAVVKKKNRPQNYVVITPVELTGQDWTEWFEDEILNKYSSKIPNIIVWDYSQLNSLLDVYGQIKEEFQKIIGLSDSGEAKVANKAQSHPLLDENEPFSNKLDYLISLISSKSPGKSKEDKLTLCILQEDTNLAWHFLKNIDDCRWFPKIKNNVVKSIVEGGDGSVKYQLLSFFEKCADRHSDEILPLLVEFEANTQDYDILSALTKTLGRLKPKNTKGKELLWVLFNKLTEHQHPWVRREISKSLSSFISLDVDAVLQVLEKVFFYSPPPQDVTQGSPTLALTFQGRDNENWVFEEAVNLLSQLLSKQKYADKALELSIKIEKEAIASEEKNHERVNGIQLDYAYIWLGDNSSEKTEYNHNRKERVALEIEKALNEMAASNKKTTISLMNKLLDEKQEVFHHITIKTLIKHPCEFKSISEKLIFNTDLWGTYNLRNYYLQTLITKYFECAKSSSDRFVSQVLEYQEKDQKRRLYTQQDLLFSLPEKLKTAKTRKKLKEISDSLKVKPAIVKPMVMTSWSGPQPDISVSELKKKDNKALVSIMVESSSGRRAEPYDIAPNFAALIKADPDKLQVLLKEIKSKKVSSDFAGHMVRAYVDKLPGKISGISKILPLLGPKDTFARIELARYFNQVCRSKEMLKHDKDTLKSIKEALFVLSKDASPNSDETIKTNRPRPDDAITRGINSVRGITVEALVAYGFYYPKDDSIFAELKRLSLDKTSAVRATLIYNLRFFISKNYAFCEGIVGKYKTRRDPETDFALLHLFANLDCKQFKAKENFIKNMFNSTHDQINEDLGELVGARYITGCDVKSLVDEIIGGRKGTKHTVRSLAFVFESKMADIIGKGNDVEVASYLKRLLGASNEFEVAERASFVFERNEITPENFEFLDANGLMSEVVANRRNIPSQSHLVNYLVKCVHAGVSVDRSVELLKDMISESGFLLNDHLIAKKISEIVLKLADKILNTETKENLLEVYNAGLERGWNEFYEIYEDGKLEN